MVLMAPLLEAALNSEHTLHLGPRDAQEKTTRGHSINCNKSAIDVHVLRDDLQELIHCAVLLTTSAITRARHARERFLEEKRCPFSLLCLPS